MANAYDYAKRVVPNYRRGMIGYAVGEQLFDRKDKSENWNMRKVAVSGADTFWEVGWLHRNKLDFTLKKCLAFETENGLIGHDENFSEPYFYPRITPPTKYWWCRDADWVPYWGKATEKRANLMKEIRAYWMNKWFSETVPEIKKTLLKTTQLPEDVVNLLPEYFEYPHQTKMVV